MRARFVWAANAICGFWVDQSDRVGQRHACELPGDTAQLEAYNAANSLGETRRFDEAVQALLQAIVAPGCLVTQALRPLYASAVADGASPSTRTLPRQGAQLTPANRGGARAFGPAEY